MTDRPGIEIRKCKTCEKDFAVRLNKLSTPGGGSFCSKACLAVSLRKPRVPRTCVVCGKTFEVHQCKTTKRQGLYCGNACRIAATKIHNTKHGHSRSSGMSRTYTAWHCMKSRATNPNHRSARHYIERGITIEDPRWLQFDNFLTDMGEAPGGMSLDRINNDRGYCKDNCRWATSSQQMQNTRANRLVTIDGRTQCLTAWARERGMRPNTVQCRIHYGMTAEQALSRPVKPWHRAK